MLGGATWCLAGATRAWLSTRALTASFDAAPDARLRMLDRAVRIDPTSGEARLTRGLLELGMDDPRAALVDLKVARVLFADVSTLVATGHAELALGHPEAAESAYRQALIYNPGSLRARAGLAESLRARGQLGEAEDAARIARKLSPGNPRVRDLLEAIREEKSDEGRD
jgi:tetratricopeptide (TPR) repeat protein